MKYTLKCMGKTISIDIKDKNLKLIPITEDLSDKIYDMFQEIPYREDYQDDNIANGLSKDDFRKYCATIELGDKDIMLCAIVQQITKFVLFDGDLPIGWFSLRTENLSQNFIHSGHLGYTIRPSQRRKGYATKGVALVVEVARALGYKQICASCDDENIGSKKTLLNNGFKPFPKNHKIRIATKAKWSDLTQYYLNLK